MDSFEMPYGDSDVKRVMAQIARDKVGQHSELVRKIDAFILLGAEGRVFLNEAAALPACLQLLKECRDILTGKKPGEK